MDDLVPTFRLEGDIQVGNARHSSLVARYRIPDARYRIPYNLYHIAHTTYYMPDNFIPSFC